MCFTKSGRNMFRMFRFFASASRTNTVVKTTNLFTPRIRCAADMMSAKIFEAANCNNLEKVKMFIEKGGISPSIRNDATFPRMTLGHIAVQKGYLDLLKYLLEKDPLLLTHKFCASLIDGPCTPLDMAIEHGHLEVVKYLVENHDADIYEVFHRYHTAVNWTIVYGHLNILKYFIEERNVDVNKAPVKNPLFPEWFQPLLFDAVEYKHKDIITYLIEEKKADLTVVNKRNENILYGAVREGNLDLVKYILDERKANIDINWKNKYGYSLVHVLVNISFLNNATDILRYLVGEKHADFDVPAGKEERTPMHLAAYKKNKSSCEIIEYLINCGADIGKQDVNGDTALHLAVPESWGCGFKICKYLCEHGANVSQRNKKGKTPFDIVLKKLSEESAYDSEKKDVIEACKLFIEHGAKVDSIDEKGDQLVHIVAMYNKMSMLDYLICVKGVDINTPRTRDNWTPLHCAAFWNHFEICKYLIEHGADVEAKSQCGKTPAEVSSDEIVIVYLHEKVANNYFPESKSDDFSDSGSDGSSD